MFYKKVTDPSKGIGDRDRQKSPEVNESKDSYGDEKHRSTVSSSLHWREQYKTDSDSSNRKNGFPTTEQAAQQDKEEEECCTNKMCDSTIQIAVLREIDRPKL